MTDADSTFIARLIRGEVPQSPTGATPGYALPEEGGR
jgi:hypothetical protein